jgi:hypothetical protein
MNAAEKSLRYLVEKWLAPTPAMRIHVIQFGARASPKDATCVSKLRRQAVRAPFSSFATTTVTGVCSHPLSHGRP